uniref:NADH-plastoquinone oxidoreductase subunit 6 n=1 Tax=Santalum album TaxID=35974 RepID=A0A6M8AUP2_SANAL|nr:NADH-plastoquinone oxidoreductase subunit 6 [Santalum album]
MGWSYFARFYKYLFVSLITTFLDTSWYRIICITKPNRVIKKDFISNKQ